MSNMSYCRFQNTRGDLDDCFGALEEATDCQHMTKEARQEERLQTFEDLSQEEARAALKLIQLCRDVVADYGDDEDVIAALTKAGER